MAEVLRFATPEPESSKIGGFTMTQTAAEILRSFDLIRSINGPAMTMVSGAPGVGKTATLRELERRLGDELLYVPIARGEGNPSHVATAIFSFWGRDIRGNDLTTLRHEVGRLVGRGRVLVVDEAQNLHQRHKASGTTGSSFDWLRTASEEGGFDLVLCGDNTLQSVIMKFPQLQSRMRRPVLIKEASRADVEAIAATSDISGREVVNALVAVAKLEGGLRNVENVIRMAELFAGGDAIKAPHIKAAIIDLKLTARDARK